MLVVSWHVLTFPPDMWTRLRVTVQFFKYLILAEQDNKMEYTYVHHFYPFLENNLR